jgi:hypothetical protein
MATAADAELILKLYELRREPRMRAARRWVLHEFQPKNLHELLRVQRDFGSEHNQYWRQVMSYWEMAAAMVLHGALDRDLFFDSVGENVYLAAKFGALSEEYAREAGNEGFMPQTMALIASHPKAKLRMEALRAHLEEQKHLAKL